jgi:hypothetical protein
MTDKAAWQDISTAPKDRTNVWLYENGHQYVGMWFEWDFTNLDHPVRPSQKGAGWLDESCVQCRHPTHWMPLPSPPEAGE